MPWYHFAIFRSVFLPPLKKAQHILTQPINHIPTLQQDQTLDSPLNLSQNPPHLASHHLIVPRLNLEFPQRIQMEMYQTPDSPLRMQVRILLVSAIQLPISRDRD